MTALAPAARASRRRARERPPGSDDLAARLDVPQLVACYEQAERDIRAGFALIARAEDSLNAAFTMNHWGSIRVGNSYHRTNYHDVDSALREARRGVWSTLIERLELRRFMSIREWDELYSQVHKGKDVPDVTAENVIAMAKQFRDRIPDMLRSAVLEVFEWLTPQRSSHKTNSKLALGRKVVIDRALETWQGRVQWEWQLEIRGAQRFNALENVFSSLDGKGSVTKTHHSELGTVIRAVPRGEPCVGETAYFHFRGFQNGNLHLTFKRLDLLKRFNMLAGGKRLTPAEGTTP